MGLFRRKEAPVPATPEELELFRHLDRQVALVVLYGLAGNEMDFLVTREDLEGMQDVADSFCTLYAAQGTMPREKARDLMEEGAE